MTLGRFTNAQAAQARLAQTNRARVALEDAARGLARCGCTDPGLLPAFQRLRQAIAELDAAKGRPR